MHTINGEVTRAESRAVNALYEVDRDDAIAPDVPYICRFSKKNRSP